MVYVCTCVCVCTYVPEIYIGCYPSISLLLFLRHCLSLVDQKFPDEARLAGQRPQRACFLCLPAVGLHACIIHRTQLFMCVLRVELGSSCLYADRASHLPSLSVATVLWAHALSSEPCSLNRSMKHQAPCPPHSKHFLLQDLAVTQVTRIH